MPKVALLSLPRPAREAVSRVFTDPAQPGVELGLTLRRLDPAELAVAIDAAASFYERFAETGFPLANGTAVPLALSLCQSLSMTQLMQCGPEEDLYSLEELIGLIANMPDAGVQVLNWASELNGQMLDVTAGNSARAA